jgi:putative ABC transport system permease protein
MVMPIYRLCLLLFPRPFRERFGQDMAEVFADRRRQARRRGRMAVAALWVRTLADVLAHGWAERRAERRRSRDGRGRWIPMLLQTLVQDVRHALRAFRRRPAVAAIALATLALGIGANSAIFSVVDVVLLKPLPYRDAGRIVHVYETNRRYHFDRGVANPFNYDTWERESASFERLAAMRGGAVTLTGAGDPARLRYDAVTAGFFDVMGIRPLLGRTLNDTDAVEGRDVVVISYRLWTSRFGSDPQILGHTLTLEGQTATVVGVMPEAFRYPEGWDVFRPLALSAKERADMHSWFLGVVGKLKPSVRIEGAQAEMDAISSRLEEEYPASRQDRGVRLVGLHEDLVSGVAEGLTLLQAVVGFVLIIACANVANMLMVGASGRRREIGIRAAIGAGRGRLARQLMTESVLLAVAGGALGVWLAHWGAALLVALSPDRTLPAGMTPGVNGEVLAFSLALSALTGLLVGVAPAFFFSRADIVDVLKDSSLAAAGSGKRGQRLLRTSLVATEVAISLAMLTGSALLAQSFLRLTSQDPGFAAPRLLTAQISLPAWRYPNTAAPGQFWSRLFDRLAAAPGVTGVAASTALPFSNWEWQTWFEVRGREGDKNDGTGIRTVIPGYFEALGVPVLAGRSFTAEDASGADPVVLVNDTFARQFLQGANPIGQELRTERPDTTGPRVTTLIGADKEQPTSARWMRIVGVVGSTRHTSLDAPPEVEIYRPLAQSPASTMILALRTSGDPLGVESGLRDVVRDLDPTLPVQQIRTMEAAIGRTTAQRRFEMWLVSLFAALAGALALIGIYGVMSYVVGLRTREMGIRLALGARPGQVRALVVRQGLVPVGFGLAAGFAGAWVLAGVLRTQLFDVAPHDPRTLAGASLAFLAVAAFACWIPARRTSRVDPIVVLREQ